MVMLSFGVRSPLGFACQIFILNDEKLVSHRLVGSNIFVVGTLNIFIKSSPLLKRQLYFNVVRKY